MVTCFRLRHRHSCDRDDRSLKSAVSHVNDDYMIMKQQLIGRPILQTELTEKQHFTERDLQTEFLTNGDKFGKMDKTKQAAQKFQTECMSNKSWWCRLASRSFPILQSLRTYRRSYLSGDLAAGLSVGIAAIPMGMSYSFLAGLPPAHGLYNNLFFPLCYMLFGTGRQVCVGTSAIEAIMSSEAVANIVGWDAAPDVRLNASIGLSLAVGVVLIGFRILGLGAMASFLADPVLSGFSTGSALIIATSQVKNLLGMKIPRASTFANWIYVLSHLGDANWGCLLITTSGILLLWFCKYANSRWFKKVPLPGSLFVIAIFIMIGYSIKIDQPPFNIEVIGDVPRGLPNLMIFNFERSNIFITFQQALWYSSLYFIIHISIAKTIAQQRGYMLDANQECLSIGLCSVVGSFLQCFPIATSVSRSSIANIVGAHTTLYNITNCLIVFLTVTAITPLLYYLPLAALSSVVLFGVFFMTYFDEAWRLLKLFSPDFILWATSCGVTVIWGAMEGVSVSVALSLIWLLKKNAFPNTAVLGRLPGTMVYRNVKRFPMAQEVPGCKILRFDASLNFSNADQFERTVIKLAQLNTGDNIYEQDANYIQKEPIKVVIIDASSINDVDVTAIRMLQSLAKRLHVSGRVMLFANWKGPMRDFLEKAHFYSVVRPEHCFLSLMDAVQWAEEFYLKDQITIINKGHSPAVNNKVMTSTIVAEGSSFSDEVIATSSHPYTTSFHYVTESTNKTERQWPVVSRPQPPPSLPEFEPL